MQADTHTHTNTNMAHTHTLPPPVLDHHGLGELMHLVQVLGPRDPDLRRLAAGNCSVTRNSELSWSVCINAKTGSTGAEQVTELDELCHPTPPDPTGEFRLK